MLVQKSTEQMWAFLEPILDLAIERLVFANKGCAKVLSDPFTDLSNDSRDCHQQSIFVAMQGHRSHALDYLSQVLQSQTSLILSDRALTKDEIQKLEIFATQNHHSLEVWVCQGLEKILAKFVHWFYDNPSQQLKVIGITGTNGKTSTTFYCAQWLEALGQSVAVIGTLGNGLLANLAKTQNTTPDVIRLTKLLHAFHGQGIDWVVMEVSSHAIALGRVAGIQFFTTAMTQITSDHLDFHGTREHYVQTKLRLFSEFVAQNVVVNLQEIEIQRNLDRLFGKTPQSKNHKDPKNPPDLWGYSVGEIVAEFNHEIFTGRLEIHNLVLDSQGMKLNLIEVATGDQTQRPLSIDLMGSFNSENLLCAASIMKTCGFGLQALVDNLCAIKPVPGRMQLVHTQPAVIIDFAHTADALQSLLAAVKAHLKPAKHCAPGQLWVIFGCGGDRDRQKRPLMAQVAVRYAEKVMLTSDNPRSENPHDILAEMMSGLSENPMQTVWQEVDRKTAIHAVLEMAKEEDIVVIAGKGHENYQEILGVKYPFSDHQVVSNFFESRTKQ